MIDVSVCSIILAASLNGYNIPALGFWQPATIQLLLFEINLSHSPFSTPNS